MWQSVAFRTRALLPAVRHHPLTPRPPTPPLQEPEAAVEGLGGTYFFMNEGGHRIAIMKPCDEEPLAPNNPKGFVGRQLGEPGLKPTVRVGEAAAREVSWGGGAGGRGRVSFRKGWVWGGERRLGPGFVCWLAASACPSAVFGLLTPLYPLPLIARWLPTCSTTTTLPACPTR